MSQADNSEQTSSEADITSFRSLHADLLHRAQHLLADLTAFQSYLQSQSKLNDVDIRQFRSSVQSEMKSLERIARVIPDEADTEEREIKRLHILRSSNLLFHESVWAAAKRCKGVIALGKRIHIERSAKDETTPLDHQCTIAHPSSSARASISTKHSITVDIIANNGRTWIKVSTITAKRLMFEMAKEGWEGYDDDSSEADSDIENGNLPGLNHGGRPALDLIRLAENMRTIASTIRVRYRHPKIHFILPKISKGQLPEIDAVIDDLRKTGAKVECAEELENGIRHEITLPIQFSSMLPRVRPPLTPNLNIDCTILLALISDISHFLSNNLPLAPNGKYHSAITRQIKSEQTTLLLQSELFPVLVGREMRCTWHAARRMREIVQTMGTAAEKERTEILFGEGNYAGLSSIELGRRLKIFSDYEVPATLRLPLAVIDVDIGRLLIGSKSSSAGRMMADVAGGLSEINQSVFLYGWLGGIVTISSNMVVTKEIERRVCQLLDNQENQRGTGNEPTGPDIWLCRTARSLIGKEKGRRDS